MRNILLGVIIRTIKFDGVFRRKMKLVSIPVVVSESRSACGNGRSAVNYQPSPFIIAPNESVACKLRLWLCAAVVSMRLRFAQRCVGYALYLCAHNLQCGSYL